MIRVATHLEIREKVRGKIFMKTSVKNDFVLQMSYFYIFSKGQELSMIICAILITK